MLTARGWWFLFAAGTTLLLGVTWLGRYSALVPLLGLALTGWVASEWVLFAYRVRAAGDHLRLDRVLYQGGRAVPSAWVGVPLTVRCVLTNTGTARLPFVLLVDRLPTDVTVPLDAHSRQAGLGPGESAAVEYTVRPGAPGSLRFEGATVHLADLAGLFTHRAFLRAPVEALVLPPLAAHDARRRGVKRFNALPPPGIHRLRRPGSGDELLDLREYQPGDPPKMIAWKASARRDTLITKEIESDVPVRCLVFVDASNAARVGPPGAAPIHRFVEVAAALVQAAVANRDLVGLTLVDETHAKVTPPARTKIHVLKILRTLTEAAGELPQSQALDADLVARYAHPVAQEMYPERLTRAVNARPLGLFWLPITDSRWFLVMVALCAAPALFVSKSAMEFVANVAAVFAPAGLSWLLFGILSLLPVACAGALWFLFGVRGLMQPRASRTSRRKQLAALFAGVDGAGPASIERLLNDDGAFTLRAAEFLHTHRVRLPLTTFDPRGVNQYRGAEKLLVLANALTRALGHARDNELYVVLIDLAELAGDLEPLAKAVRAARARHHAVMVLLPWPADVPLVPDAPEAGRLKLGTLVQTVLAGRARANFDDARRLLAGAGATVVRLDADDSPRLVLERLDRLRTGGRSRR